MGKKKKVYRVKKWDNIDAVKFLDVSNQEPLFPGIDRLGKVYLGEIFFDDLICSLFTVYDMEGRRFLTFHLKGSKRYLLCRFRMKILNKLKKNIFTAQHVFTKFTNERYMIENFDKDNYKDDEIVNEIVSYNEWLLYEFNDDFDYIKHLYIREMPINQENEINSLVESRRQFPNYSNINIDELYFSDILYLKDLYLYEVFLWYDEPIHFTLNDKNNNLYLCILTENNTVSLPNIENHYYEYVLAKITKDEINSLLLRKETINDFLSKSNNVYLITNQGTGIVVEKVNYNSIPENRKIEANTYLEF